MTKVATICPVWCEARWLPLIIEQMELCPGPAELLWQDVPLHWLGVGEYPSGWKSGVNEAIANVNSTHLTIRKIAKAPYGPFGGYPAMLTEAMSRLRDDLSIDVVVLLDSDWIFDLDEMAKLYAEIESNEPKYWAVKCQHYWRTFNQVLSDGDITVAFPTKYPDIFRQYTADEIQRTNYRCYHPAYVMSDDEMYAKVHSWGHAPEFLDRKFYELEWIGKDDSKVNPQPSTWKPVETVLERMCKYGCIKSEWL